MLIFFLLEECIKIYIIFGILIKKTERINDRRIKFFFNIFNFLKVEIFNRLYEFVF